MVEDECGDRTFIVNIEIGELHGKPRRKDRLEIHPERICPRGLGFLRIASERLERTDHSARRRVEQHGIETRSNAACVVERRCAKGGAVAAVEPHALEYFPIYADFGIGRIPDIGEAVMPHCDVRCEAIDTRDIHVRTDQWKLDLGIEGIDVTVCINLGSKNGRRAGTGEAIGVLPIVLVLIAHREADRSCWQSEKSAAQAQIDDRLGSMAYQY